MPPMSKITLNPIRLAFRLLVRIWLWAFHRKDVVTLEQREKHCFPVSRHNLETQGITCPRCGEQAVEPGDWTKVHRIERNERTTGRIYYEEAVCCWNCDAFLLASPDDETDPIGPGAKYDLALYHSFDRPEGWEPPRQRIINRPVEVDDWVVVWEHYVEELDHIKRDLFNAEGRVSAVKEVEGEKVAECILAGYAGLDKTLRTDIPTKYLRPMQFDRFKVGNKVEVIRGEHRGLRGTIERMRGANMVIKEDLQGDSIQAIELPMERVKRLDHD